MDATQLLILIFLVMAKSEYSETTDPQCEDLNPFVEEFNLIEGESFQFVPTGLTDPKASNEQVKWYKNTSRISFDETERIHYHGRELYLLNVTSNDSDSYTCQYKTTTGRCFNFHANISVYQESFRNRTELLYGRISHTDENKHIQCPSPISTSCSRLNGKVTWYKLGNATLLPNEEKHDLWIPKATKKDEGVYVCVCTWTHNHRQYKSTGARALLVPEQSACRDLEILPTFDKEQFVYEGSKISLNCSVLCGIKTTCGCTARWEAKETVLKRMSAFHKTSHIAMEDLSQNVIATEVLTIERVSPDDFAEFTCVGEGFAERVSYTVTLKRRESMIPLVIAGVCVFFLCVFAAVIVKCFAIDLALIFRRCLPFSRAEKGAMAFDAYVVYQLQSEDKATEDTLCHFVTKVLPEVLEEKCGYRLFIHGRDDIPGEDRLELVEDCMRKSRRLIVILTPGSGSGSEVKEQNLQQPVLGGFDWQVGLHHALVQRDMTVILIQLGDTGPQGYTHLPPGLQHLIQKSAPIRWPQGSRGAASSNSRFWKRVRYLMPAIPAKKCLQSEVV